jgi:hypothetical protein
MPRCQTPDTAGLRPAPTVPVGGADPPRRHDSAGADTGPRMLVAAYARVSSDRPDREQTIDSQSDALRRAAEQRGWHLAADLICRDDGRTGTTLVRPGLDRRRDLVAEGTGAAVLLCSPDRLARNFASQVFASQVLVIDQFRPAARSCSSTRPSATAPSRRGCSRCTACSPRTSAPANLTMPSA